MRKTLMRKMSFFLWSLALALSLPFVSEGAMAATLQTVDIIQSYKSCYWHNNGDGTSTIKLAIDFKKAEKYYGKFEWASRGILIYTYDESGKLVPNSNAAIKIQLNDEKNERVYRGNDYFIYYGGKDGTSAWYTKSPFVANMEILIDNSKIAKWPGLVVRAGGYTTGDDVGEIKGGVYFSKMGGTGACTLVDPAVPPLPPPAAITIDVAAPDWNLGELPRGVSEKTLSGLTEQLCFTYTGVDSSRQFVIDATSENGTSDGKFSLKNVSNASHKIPYSVALDSGVNQFIVPNPGNSPVTLNNGNRTCFVPTFKTSVGGSVDLGNYSDVLTFTIVTKT